MTTKIQRRFGGAKLTRRTAAITVALLMIAAPAGASIIVQNYMEANITATPPCFVKVGGSDDGSAGASFLNDPAGSGTSTVVSGVDVVEELVTLNGMVGDRVIYTDMVHYQNNCGEDIDVQLRTLSVSDVFDNMAVELWIGDSTATGAPVVAGSTGWDATYIDIPATTPDGAFVATTGSVTVSNGDYLRGAFIVTTDYAFTGTPGIVNWVAEATIS